MSVVIGWDVGGAHLKGARAEQGRLVAAMQIASPLWQGLSRLDEAFRVAKSKLGPAEAHAVTMTGELSMAFPSRAAGVDALASLTAATLAPAPVRFYAGRAGFVSLDEVGAHRVDIASANWHASAALVARHCRDALFVDMGSTTTDIIPIIDGAVAARGYTDAERLVTGELVYVGLVRNLVLASAAYAPFHGKWTPLMNEDFANMADVHRIIGDLPKEADVQATTDGRDKSVEASRMRLARMVGRDANEMDETRVARARAMVCRDASCATSRTPRCRFSRMAGWRGRRRSSRRESACESCADSAAVWAATRSASTIHRRRAFGCARRRRISRPRRRSHFWRRQPEARAPRARRGRSGFDDRQRRALARPTQFANSCSSQIELQYPLRTIAKRCNLILGGGASHDA